MKTLLVSAMVTLALVSGTVSLSAHHSWPVNMDKLVTVKGTVMQFEWANPHPMITLEVRNDDGSGGMTLHDLAAEYKVSAERIRQIEVAAMKKMKKALAAYA